MDFLRDMRVLQDQLGDLARQNNEQALDLIQLRSKVAALGSNGGAPEVYVGSYTNLKSTNPVGSARHTITIPTAHTFENGEQFLIIGRVEVEIYLSSTDASATILTAQSTIPLNNIQGAFNSWGRIYTPGSKTDTLTLCLPMVDVYTIKEADGIAGTNNMKLSSYVNSSISGAASHASWTQSATLALIKL